LAAEGSDHTLQTTAIIHVARPRGKETVSTQPSSRDVEPVLLIA
jgi:hypothetical protein